MQYHFETKDQLKKCLRDENDRNVKSMTKEILGMEDYLTESKVAYEKAMKENQNCESEMMNSEDSESITIFSESSEALHKACKSLVQIKTQLSWAKKSIKDGNENFERFLQSELKGFQEFLDEREVSDKNEKRKFDEAKAEEEKLSLAFVAKMGWG
jgi:TPP-dependent trihydroxycyclohexane-1,2-dione (THcHDO) dehydratase